MDRFNRVYGWVTFFSVSCVVVYFSVEMIMKGQSSAEGMPQQRKIAYILGGLDSFLLLVATAMVNYSVSGLIFVASRHTL